jgi:hypothetical protein
MHNGFGGRQKYISQGDSVFWIWAFIWTVFATTLTTLFISVFHGYVYLLAASVLIIVIAVSNYVFLRQGLRYFSQSELMKGFALSFLLHYFYVLYIGLSGAFTKKYQWKGRMVINNRSRNADFRSQVKKTLPALEISLHH